MKTSLAPSADQAYGKDDGREPARTIWNKIRLRQQLPLMVIIVLSSLDRVNISFAALHMNAALGMSAEAFGVAVGMFFVGYLLFQFPSTAIQRRIGTRRWMTGTILVWGMCAMGMSVVHHATTLYSLRFLLGVAESGLSPGIVYFCSTWMPRRFQAGAIAITLLAIPVSVIIGGPLSGWLMSSANPLGLDGWRWMFLMEGLPSIVIAALVYGFLSDSADGARWLSPGEKSWLRKEMDAERDLATAREGRSGGRAVSPTAVFATPAVWAAAGMWFALLLGSNGIIFWLPQVLRQISGATDMAVGVMSAVPWIGIGCGMIFNARHSDRQQERYWHVGISTAVGALGIVLAVLAGPRSFALVFLFLGGIGIGGAQSVFWAIPRSILAGALLSSGITLINLVGNVASLIGPYAIGALRHSTGSFQMPIYLIAAVLLASILLIPIVRHSEQQQS